MKTFVVGVLIAILLAGAAAGAYVGFGISAEEYFSTDAAQLKEGMPEEFRGEEDRAEQ